MARKIADMYISVRDGGFARVARCVHAMAPAALAHARPYSRVLAGHRKRDRVQLRVACVQCCLCKECGCEQSWQHCASHGVRHACVLDDAQPVSIIPCVRARKRGRHGLRRPGQRAGAQRACCFGATWAFGGFFLSQTAEYRYQIEIPQSRAVTRPPPVAQSMVCTIV